MAAARERPARRGATAPRAKPSRKASRRDRRRCIHYFDYGNCGITTGSIHWSLHCNGAYRCEYYKERKQKKQ